MSAYAKRAAIALGYNNLAGLTQLHRLNPPYFEYYRDWITIEYTAFEAQELSLARHYKRFGLPSCVWVFEALYVEELQYLFTTYIDPSYDDAELTIRSFDSEFNSWRNYNALLKRPEITTENWNGYEYRNLRLEFYDLEVLT